MRVKQMGLWVLGVLGVLDRERPVLEDHHFGHSWGEQRSFCDERKPQVSAENTSLL